MSDLNVTFAGLALLGPVLVQTDHTQLRPRLLAEVRTAGAAAIILPPLTDAAIGRISNKAELLENNLTALSHERAIDAIAQLNADAYFALIGELREVDAGPIMAALHFHSRRHWRANAQRAARAGADALVMHLIDSRPVRNGRSDAIEKQALRILAEVVDLLDIPVIAYVPTNITGLLDYCVAVAETGVKAIILQPPPAPPLIDVSALSLSPETAEAAHRAAARQAIETVRHLYRRVNVHLAPVVQMPNPELVAQAVIAGATTVIAQYASARPEAVATAMAGIGPGLSRWMKGKSFSALYDVRGVLSESRLSSSLERESNSADHPLDPAHESVP